jgi:hypothetical protein
MVTGSLCSTSHRKRLEVVSASFLKLRCVAACIVHCKGIDVLVFWQYEQLGVSGVFPLVFFAELGATCGLYAAHQAVRAKCRNGSRPPIEWAPWIRTAIVLGLSCYSQVTNSVLLYMQVCLSCFVRLQRVLRKFIRSVQCVDIGSSKVVFTVPAIDCRCALLLLCVCLLIDYHLVVVRATPNTLHGWSLPSCC